jgi:hypothetical protein
VLGPIRPRATAHGARWPATPGRFISWLGLDLAAQSSRAGSPRHGNGARTSGAQGMVTTRISPTWWRAHRRCCVGWPVARCCRRALEGSRGGTRQVKEGRDQPARRDDGEAERRLGAATRGDVLAGEGVGGDIGELHELWGGGREVRACSIGGRKA